MKDYVHDVMKMISQLTTRIKTGYGDLSSYDSILRYMFLLSILSFSILNKKSLLLKFNYFVNFIELFI